MKTALIFALQGNLNAVVMVLYLLAIIKLLGLMDENLRYYRQRDRHGRKTAATRRHHADGVRRYHSGAVRVSGS